MKIQAILLLLCMLIIACNDQPKNEPEMENEKEKIAEVNPLEGAWELISYYNYENDVVIDSFNQREGFRQVKMYSPTKVMWSKQVPTDSTEWFGYGTYKIEDGQLIEVLDYGSRMMTTIIDENEEFIFDLIINGNKFSQVELDEEGNKIYSENYRRIE